MARPNDCEVGGSSSGNSDPTKRSRDIRVTGIIDDTGKRPPFSPLSFSCTNRGANYSTPKRESDGKTVMTFFFAPGDDLSLADGFAAAFSALPGATMTKETKKISVAYPMKSFIPSELEGIGDEFVEVRLTISNKDQAILGLMGNNQLNQMLPEKVFKDGMANLMTVIDAEFRDDIREQKSHPRIPPNSSSGRDSRI